jgi:hypothetical protein
MAYRRKGIKK